MRMKFTITIDAETQPQLIHGLKECIKQLQSGVPGLNCWCGGCNILLQAADKATATEFRRQFDLAHPPKNAPWDE